MKIKLSAIILSIFISRIAFGCDCKDLRGLDSLRAVSYDNSELVFLGELIDYDTINHSYTFQVIENYKGIIKTNLIKGKCFDSCSKYPKDKCKWIIYANYKTTDYIDNSQCLASRSIMNPYSISCYVIPPPTKQGVTNFEYKKEMKALEITAKKDWHNEIDILQNLNQTK